MRALAIASLVVLVGPAHADEHCRPVEWGSPALERIDARVRLRWIQERIEHAAHRMLIWQLAWVGIYGAVTIANTAGLATSNNETDYIDWGLGVGSSVLYLVGSSIPPRVIRDARQLRREASAQRNDANAERDVCAQLADAERMLVRDARDVAKRRGWVAHGANFVFNIGLFVGLVLIGHYGEAVMHGATELIVGEIQILTTPRDALEDLTRYRLGLLDNRAPPSWRLAWSVAPLVASDRIGVALRIVY